MPDLVSTYNELKGADPKALDQSGELDEITQHEGVDDAPPADEDKGEDTQDTSDTQTQDTDQGDQDAGDGSDEGDKGKAPQQVDVQTNEYHMRNSQALENLMQIPQVRQVIADAMTGKFEQADQQEAAPDLSAINFSEMSDPEIADTIASAAVFKLKGNLGSRLDKVEGLLNQLIGQKTEEQFTKQINDSKTFPLAKQNSKAIQNLMSKGLDFETAYYAACGKQLKDQGFQTGLRKAAEKSGKDLIPSGKGKPNQNNAPLNKKATTIQEAYDQIMASKKI